MNQWNNFQISKISQDYPFLYEDILAILSKISANICTNILALEPRMRWNLVSLAFCKVK